MRVLITGGNGYVGREPVRLLRWSHDVCVVDSLRYGSVRFGDADLAGICLERVDIECLKSFSPVTEDFRPQIVVHLAAIHYIPECEQNPTAAVRTNVVGTVNALMACPPGCRFVFASSGAVYAPDDRAHDEEASALGPTNVYGFSKLQRPTFAIWPWQRGLNAVNVRLFNVIGPGETNPHLLPEIVTQLKAGRAAIRLGNLWPKRDYIHVRDAVRGFAAAALQGVVPDGETVTVNLGTSRPYSVLEILQRLRRISGLQFKIEEDRDRVRAVDRPHLAASRMRIQNMFGWTPELSIDEALSDLWSNPDLAGSLTQRYPPLVAA